MDWAPPACTLPTAERPLRRAEFEALFRTTLVRVDRPSPTLARLTLRGDDQLAASVRDLTARETACCSFFDFAVRSADDVELEIGVPAGYIDVLDGLLRVARDAAAAR